MTDFNEAGQPATPDMTAGPMAPLKARRLAGRWTRAGLLGAVLVGGVALGAGGLAVAAAGPGAMEWMHGSRLERVQGFVRRALDGVGATSDQEAKAHDLVAAAFKDAEPAFAGRAEMRKQALDLLRAPTIDAAAIETLRADRMARLDAASKRMVTTLVGIAEVLTPEQRVKLADRAEAFAERGPGGRGHHGWGGHRWDRRGGNGPGMGGHDADGAGDDDDGPVPN